MRYFVRPFLLLSWVLLALGSISQSVKAQVATEPHSLFANTVATRALAALPAAPKVGDTAPEFKLPYATQEKIFLKPDEWISLSSLRGKAVILAFYPADFSGGCTTEVCTLRDSFADLGKLNATVLGISGDYVFSHQEWAKKHNLPFALASDHDHTVAKQYDSFNAAAGYNKRTIFLIDKAGVIRYVNLEFKAADKAGYDALKAELAKLSAQ